MTSMWDEQKAKMDPGAGQTVCKQSICGHVSADVSSTVAKQREAQNLQGLSILKNK